MLTVDVYDSTLHIYKLSMWTDSIQKASVHTDVLSWLKTQVRSWKKTPVVILLDETEFDYHRVSVRLDSSAEPLSRSVLKSSIDENSKELCKEYGIEKSMMQYSLMNMRCDDRDIDFLVGEQWIFEFDIWFYLLKYALQWLTSMIAADSSLSDLIRVLPRSFFLLQHPELQKRAGSTLLFIGKQQTRLISLRHNRYDQIHSLNTWSSLLREAYESRWVDQYVREWSSLSENDLALKLATEATEVSLDMFFSRWDQFMIPENDLFLMSSLIEHPLFTEQFGKRYTSTYHTSVIPYRGSELPKKYGRKRWEDEVCVLAALNG